MNKDTRLILHAIAMVAVGVDTLRQLVLKQHGLTDATPNLIADGVKGLIPDLLPKVGD